MLSLALAEANDAGDLGVGGGVPFGLVYVEDRPMGPKRWPGGLLVGNMLKVFSVTGNNKARSDTCRFIAKEFFPRPVYGARWPAVRDAVYDRAVAHGTTPEEELVAATALAIALIHPLDVVTTPELSFELLVARQINDLVTEDFLGPGWRRRYGTRTRPVRELPEKKGLKRSGESLEDDVLMRQYGRELIERAKLSKGEADVLRAAVEGQVIEDWAESRGIRGSGARNALSRARRKLRDAMG